MEAQGGNRGSAKGTDHATCSLKVRNCLPTERAAHISSQHLVD